MVDVIVTKPTKMIPLAMDNITNTRRKIRHQNSLRNGEIPPNGNGSGGEKNGGSGIYFVKSDLQNWISEEPENESFERWVGIPLKSTFFRGLIEWFCLIRA